MADVQHQFGCGLYRARTAGVRSADGPGAAHHWLSGTASSSVLPLNFRPVAAHDDYPGIALRGSSWEDAGVRLNSPGGAVLVVLLLVAVAIVSVGGLVTWVVRARSCARVIDAPAGQEQEGMFYGGIMCKQLTTSGTLVRLEMLDWGVRIRGIAPARWVVPTWEARYDELALAELVASPFSRIAVWLRLRGEPGGMGFLSNQSQDILRILQKHEVPVNRAITRFNHVDDLYRAAR
jgi:hypothetical protein